MINSVQDCLRFGHQELIKVELVYLGLLALVGLVLFYPKIQWSLCGCGFRNSNPWFMRASSWGIEYPLICSPNHCSNKHPWFENASQTLVYVVVEDKPCEIQIEVECCKLDAEKVEVHQRSCVQKPQAKSDSKRTTESGRVKWKDFERADYYIFFQSLESKFLSSRPTLVSVDVEEKPYEVKIEVDGSKLSNGDVEVLLRSCLKKPRADSCSKRSVKRRVNWMDYIGKELVEIKEFETHESRKTDEDANADPLCMCVIQ